MNRYYYDLHIHSCLSPCGDDDMTPNNIAGMGAVAGLQILALTDHNTCGNCPAFFDACKRYGIIPIAGMELTTTEDIHLVCLFEQLENAMRFDTYIYKHILPVENVPEIFGRQLFMDGEDNIIGEQNRLLLSATDIGIESAASLVHSYGGICYPAHVDRSANGIIAILGDFPEYLGFSACEFYDQTMYESYCKRYSAIKQCMTVCSSDAHNLGQIRDADSFFDLDDEPYSSTLVRQRLFERLLFH